MFKFLFIIFGFFLLLMALLGFSVIRTFKRILFGGNDSTKQKQYKTESNRKQKTQSTTTTQSGNVPTKKKIIAKDEGEYVEYEEIKD